MTRTLDAYQVNMLNEEAVYKVVNTTYGAASFLWNGQSNPVDFCRWEMSGWTGGALTIGGCAVGGA
ncbi:hypothetical protein MKX41_22835 [Paenibacillus sp. FSL R5-0475]|uniref:hypothetical protein n=1 Tax=Paenibacillus sp. FSL R5-0475 TaxID=2921643 RepID=UPI0030F703FA